MNRALGVSGGAVGSPFGAAHRVYLDTPPLKGLRLLPIGSKRERSHN